MSRLNLIGFVLTFALAAAAAPARADEWEEESREQGAGAVRANGEVSVDIEGATPGLNLEVFRSTLAPYGEWRVSPRYGEVWRPRVAIGWRPYYDGSWLWTDEGWYWDSSEPFAWAVYHYGRWVYDPAWGWVWVPGYQWAPAWVTWRYGGDVVGWAPLGPGVSVFVTAYPFIDFWWTFVPCYQFVGVPVYTVAYPPRDTHRWFGSTAPAPPRTLTAPRSGGAAPAPAWGGPSRRFIEERTGRPVAVERRPAWRPEAGAGERGPGAQRQRVPTREQRQDSWRGGGREQAPAWGPPPAREERREGGRPEVRPAPRGEGNAPRMGPAPRGDGGQRMEPRPSAEPRRSRGR